MRIWHRPHVLTQILLLGLAAIGTVELSLRYGSPSGHDHRYAAVLEPS